MPVPVEVIFFLGPTKRCTTESYLRLSESEFKNKSLKYEKKENTTLLYFDLFHSFHIRVADIKVAEPDCGLFRSVIKNVLLQLFRCDFFFYVEKSPRIIQNCRKIANIMKHDQKAGSRKRANLSCNIKHAPRRFFGGGYLEMPKVLGYVYHPIFLGTL